MSIYEQFDVDQKKETEGVWFWFPGKNSKPGFLIARMGGGNKKFGAVHAEKNAPYLAQRQAGNLPEDVSQRISIEVFVESSLLNWADIRDRAGNVIPFSTENAVKLMLDLPELFNELWMRALDRENFLAEQTEVAAGN